MRTSPQRLGYLKAWCPVGGTIWGGLGNVVSWRKCVTGGGLWGFLKNKQTNKQTQMKTWRRILMVVQGCQRLKANTILNEKREIMEQCHPVDAQRYLCLSCVYKEYGHACLSTQLREVQSLLQDACGPAQLRVQMKVPRIQGGIWRHSRKRGKKAGDKWETSLEKTGP